MIVRRAGIVQRLVRSLVAPGTQTQLAKLREVAYGQALPET